MRSVGEDALRWRSLTSVDLDTYQQLYLSTPGVISIDTGCCLESTR